MTYFLFNFVFMLMYGGCVAVLAYKAGKTKKRPAKGLNRSGNVVYIDTSKIEVVVIDESEGGVAMVNFDSHTRLICQIKDNPWVDDFIQGK